MTRRWKRWDSDELFKHVASQPLGTFCTIGIITGSEDDEGLVFRKTAHEAWTVVERPPGRDTRDNDDLILMIRTWDHPWSMS